LLCRLDLVAEQPGFRADVETKKMQLREMQMKERRTRILNAAERLIRKSGSTDFSVRALAVASAVSPVTPFNIFGSKEGLLYALLSRSLDRFFSKGLTFTSPDPNYHVVEAAEIAVDIFVSDPKFLRPLYQVLLGVPHAELRPKFMQRTFTYWNTALLTIPGITKTHSEAHLNVLTHALMAHFIGLMELWIHKDFDDESFRIHVICGFILIVMSAVSKKNLPAMRAYLEEAEAKLPAIPSAESYLTQ
jgi:AcrR family transcriptional regulator